MTCPEEDGLFKEIELQTFFIMNKKQRFTLWKNVTRITLLILSALITLISGWDATQDDQVSATIMSFDISEGHLILILSTIVTFMTAMEALFRYTDKSATYGIMLFEMRTLKRKMCYDFEKDPELFQTNKDNYFKEYQDILQSQKELLGDAKSS